jgi:hypothetical protein
MTIYHKHHIVPKHMGGTDDESNLILLTVEQHAEAHRELYELHGQWQDKLAWQGLSRMINHQEVISLIMHRPRGPRSDETIEKIKYTKKLNPYKHSDEIKLKISSSNLGKIFSEEHKNKISKSHVGMKKDWLKGNKHASSLKGKQKSISHQEAINKALDSLEVKQKISSTWANKPTVKCPFCEKEGKEGHNMNRFHFNNCKRIL